MNKYNWLHIPIPSLSITNKNPSASDFQFELFISCKIMKKNKTFPVFKEATPRVFNQINCCFQNISQALAQYNSLSFIPQLEHFFFFPDEIKINSRQQNVERNLILISRNCFLWENYKNSTNFVQFLNCAISL